MRPRPRNAVASVALAAAGMVYRRLAGREGHAPPAAPAPPPSEPAPDRADDTELARARHELADALERRAARSEP
jgi:hypothetical protein